MPWYYLPNNRSDGRLELLDVIEISEVKNIDFTCKNKDNLWGLLSFLDIKNQFIWKITPQYKDAGSFNEGLFPCKLENHWGFVNQNNQLILPFVWDYAFSFSHNFSVVMQNNKWGIINREGEWLIAPSANYLRSFSDNLAVGHIKNTWFTISTLGKSTVLPKWDYVRSFHKGLAAFNVGGTLLQSNVIMGGKWGFCNNGGEIIIPSLYSWVGNFIDSYAPYFKEEDNEWGVLTLKGEEILLKSVSGVREFINNMAIIEENNLWGVCSLSGNHIIKPQYSDIKAFSRQGFLALEEI